MPARNPSPVHPDIDPPLHLIRGHRVILDADLAHLYGTTTKQLNQAIRRNPERFPSDFAFQLIPEEWDALNRSQIVTGSENDPMRSQSVTASPGDSMRSQFAAAYDLAENPSQIVIGSEENGDSGEISADMPSQFAIASPKTAQAKRNARFLPWAFTEHGALMAGTILRSPRAVQMSLYIVRAFVKLRQIALENENLSRRMIETELALRAHDVILTDIYDKLEPLLDPEPDAAKPESVPERKFGFETGPS